MLVGIIFGILLGAAITPLIQFGWGEGRASLAMYILYWFFIAAVLFSVGALVRGIKGEDKKENTRILRAIALKLGVNPSELDKNKTQNPPFRSDIL